MIVDGTDGKLVPGIPTIAGLTPRSVQTQGTRVVALFAIDQPGLYVVGISGASATSAGKYSVNLTVAGDLNGDGNVDGNDSALLAAAMGSVAGGAHYSVSADINGDGKVDGQDQVLLAAAYGFHATTPAAFNAPPSRPTFDLDVNSDTEPVGDGMTIDSVVTLVGQTDPNVTVTLQQTGAVVKSNPNGLFAFFNVPLVAGDNAFTVVATNASNASSQFTKIITRTQAGMSLIAPVISAHLANDTGRSSLDNITNDDTVTGSVTAANALVSFQAQVDQSQVVDISAALGGSAFTITPAMLATLNGGPLSDGKHTLTLIARDVNGNISQPVTVSFILTTTPPASVSPVLLAASDTGISSNDGITRLNTPTFEIAGPANSIIRLYVDGHVVGQATATAGPVFITTTPLTSGPHAITATAEDVAGNVSQAGSPLTIMIDTAPPTAPTLGLDAASQTAPGQTNKSVVNLVGQTDAGAYVALYRQSDPNTAIRNTQADTAGKFTFTNISLAPGSQAFIAVAGDVAGNSSEITQTILTTATDTAGPAIAARLANDTGLSSTDGITSDATITGVVDDPSGVASFLASLDGGKAVNVTWLLSGAGFTFTGANLATINGGVALPDGAHTLTLQATDSLGNASAATSISFNLQSARPLPPSNVGLIASDLTGSSNSITKARSLTVQMSAASGTIVTLYMNGMQIGQQTATSSPLNFPVAGQLADGQYLFTATAATVSGLVSPFSTPFTVTVDNTIPAIASFGLDTLSDARPYGHNLTVFAVVGLTGQTAPGAEVTLVETGARTTSDASGNFSFYPVSLPNVGAYTFTLKVTDVAGNVNSEQKTFTRIANTLPVEPAPAGRHPDPVGDHRAAGGYGHVHDPDDHARRPAARERGPAHQRQGRPDDLAGDGLVLVGHARRVQRDDQGVRCRRK